MLPPVDLGPDDGAGLVVGWKEVEHLRLQSARLVTVLVRVVHGNYSVEFLKRL